MYNGRIYNAIPAVLAPSEMIDLLQSFAEFGYIGNVIRSGECAQYSYEIRWLTSGRQPHISIVNATGIRPLGSLVTAIPIQEGDTGNNFYQVPNDMLRTYHKVPQVFKFIHSVWTDCLYCNLG